MRNQGHTNTFRYKADDGAGTGDAAGADAGTDAAATDTTGTSGADRSFSTADVERIVKERLTRERAKYEGFDDLKTKAAEFDKLQEANKSELEKAVARADSAEKERELALAEAKETRLRAAILAEAAKPDRRVVDPDLVATLLGPDVTLDDNGAPTNVAEAMDSLLKARPYLVATGGSRGNADQGAREGGGQQLSRDQLKTMSPEAIVKAQSEGLLDHLMAGTT